MEVFDKDVDTTQDLEFEDAQDTSFITPAVSEPSTSGISVNNPVARANAALREGGLPDIDTITAKKGWDVNKRLLAAMISEEKPKGEDGLENLIKKYNDFVENGGTYDDFVSKRDIKDAPSPPGNTPGIDTLTQQRIDSKLSELGFSFTIDHSKFTVLQDGGLRVETSAGTKQLTQKSNPRYFNERPGISDKDYHSILGVSKKEYLKLVRSRNEKLRNFE